MLIYGKHMSTLKEVADVVYCTSEQAPYSIANVIKILLGLTK